MKLSPEERKEKRIEVNRQYQLKNKEVLKEKRKEYLKKRLQNMTEEQKNKTITTPLKRKPPKIPPSQKSPQYRKIPTSL